MGFLLAVIVIIGIFVFMQRQKRAGSSSMSNSRSSSSYAKPVKTKTGKEDIIDLPIREIAEDQESLPYKKKAYFFSSGEKTIYNLLTEALDDREAILLAKVRILDVLYIEGTEHRQTYMNKIQSKHLDFLICDKNRVAPLLAIELDDTGNNSTDKVKRDEFISKALNTAGLPLLRLSIKQQYSLRTIKDKLAEHLGPTTSRQITLDETGKDNITAFREVAAGLADKQYTCTHCGKPVTEKVVQFCLNNPSRFGGKVYCYDHQNLN